MSESAALPQVVSGTVQIQTDIPKPAFFNQIKLSIPVPALRSIATDTNNEPTDAERPTLNLVGQEAALLPGERSQQAKSERVSYDGVAETMGDEMRAWADHKSDSGWRRSTSRAIWRTTPGLLATSLVIGLAMASVVMLPAQVASAATDVVTTCSGDATVPGSLPYEVANASSGETINFSVTCPPSSPITLAATLEITNNVTIEGPGNGLVVVSGAETIYMPGPTVDISGLSFENVDFYSDDGGTLTLSNCTLSHLQGINIEGGQTNVTDSTITDSSSPYGGAILAYYGTVNVTDSTLSDNSAGYIGGAIDNNGGDVNVTDSTLSGNVGDGGGGGIANNYNGTVNVSNSTLVENSSVSANGGGGIFNLTGEVNLTNSTLSGNSIGSGELGADIYNESGGTVEATATIVANGYGGDCSGTITDVGYNLDDDGSCGFSGTSLSDTAAGLDPSGLQDNGGPTQTIALVSGSAAIGAVNNASLCSTTDQLGATRPTPCDIGAVELVLIPQTITFTSTPPSNAVVGGPSYSVSASGGASGNPVTLSIDTSASSVCSITGSTVAFIGVGTCVIDANQSGGGGYSAAPQGQQSFTVYPTPPPTTWIQLFPATSPTARFVPTMADDSATGQFILFGGYGNTGAANDTWSWNGSNWVELFPATSPPARYSASMAYDPGTGQLILFGGYNSSNGYLDDTWTWNGSTWTQLFPATSPSARSGAALAYNQGTGQLVLFGGSTYTNDTWTWNGSTWTQLFPATSPSARSDCALTYDPGTGQFLLFGGYGNGPQFNDTWTWNGSTWNQLSPSVSPSVRYNPATAFDPGTGQLILFGGVTTSNAILDDTWTWNGSTWVQLSPVTSPPPDGDASMEYDPGAGQLILFGGTNGSGYTDETWTYSPGGSTFAQSITFTSTPPSNATVGGPSYSVSATGGDSGNPVTFSIDPSAASACSISQSTVSFIGSGVCVIDANQDGSANFSTAPQVEQIFSVGPEAKAITSANSATAVSGFAVLLQCDTTGTPAPSITEKGKLPKGLKFTNNGNGTATIYGTPKKKGVSI